MKNLFRVLSLIFVTGLMFTACEEDTGGGGGGDQAPLVTATTAATVVSAGESFEVSVSATAGDGEMNDLSIYEDGILIDVDRIVSISGIATPNNPALLFDADRSSFSFDITLRAHSTATTNSYSFEVTDTNNEFDSESVSITVESDPPTLTYMGPDEFTGVAPGSLLSFQINAIAGSVPMDSISVLEDGVLVDAARLSLGATDFDANPYGLTGDWKNEIMENMILRVHDSAGTKNYTVIIKDEGGMTSEFTIPISTGIAVDMIMGVLFNAGGPAGTGGLDLDDGVGTGSASSLAEIKDLGIDPDLPGPENWIQRIVGVNGYEARYLFPGLNGLPETFTFGSVSFQEEIVSLWENNSSAFTSMDSDGNTVSFAVEVGDIFIVSNGANYYMVDVTEVNVTVDDNGDNYVVDIIR